jgi:hypothetical protein
VATAVSITDKCVVAITAYLQLPCKHNYICHDELTATIAMQEVQLQPQTTKMLVLRTPQITQEGRYKIRSTSIEGLEMQLFAKQRKTNLLRRFIGTSHNVPRGWVHKVIVIVSLFL